MVESSTWIKLKKYTYKIAVKISLKVCDLAEKGLHSGVTCPCLCHGPFSSDSRAFRPPRRRGQTAAGPASPASL